MVTHLARRDVFQAIADPNRRAIISLLSQKKLTLNGVAEHFTISRPAISKHVKLLEECGLINIEQIGRERYCEIKLEKLTEVSDWIEQYRQMWETRLDALEVYLEELQSEKTLQGSSGKNKKKKKGKKHGKRK
jgi:DNA-binding transcriptional ArsR family regulator